MMDGSDQAPETKQSHPNSPDMLEEKDKEETIDPKKQIFKTPGAENANTNLKTNSKSPFRSDPNRSFSIDHKLYSPPPQAPKVSDVKGSAQSYRSDDFPFPPPYPVRYMSSAGFSDITLPLPNLTSTQSFGGFSIPPTLHTYASGEHQLPPGTFYYVPHPPVPQTTHTAPDPLHLHHDPNPSVRQQQQQEGTSIPHERSDMDNIAARALLDLTPNVSETTAVAPQKENPNKRKMEQVSDIPTSRHQYFATAPTPSSHRSILVSSRAQRLLENVPFTTVACKCKNSKCLKLYCSCFQAGTLCDSQLCQCDDCSNTTMESKARENRMKAIFDTLKRRPDAFEPRLRKRTGEGCFCKKTRCLRKYCDCYANNQSCSSKCGCDDCHNGGQDVSKTFSMHKPPASAADYAQMNLNPPEAQKPHR